MIRTLAIAVAVAVVSASSAHAAADCVSKYANFWEKMNQYGEAKMSPETALAVNRIAIRAFDACESGDTFSLNGFWDQLKQAGEAKLGTDEFWKELSLYGEAKK